MLLPYATWSHWNSPYHFIQLNIESYDIIQGFVHFTKMDVILYQIKLIITIFNLYKAFPRGHRPDVHALGWSWNPLWDVTPYTLE